MRSRRQFIQPLAALALLSPWVCGAAESSAKKIIKLTFGIINYTDHTVYDVALNGRGYGLAPPYFGMVASMLLIPFETGGPQKVTWRHAATGDVVVGKNPLFIREEDMPRGGKAAPYMCIHIYPDASTELSYTAGEAPQPTARGIALLKAAGPQKGPALPLPLPQ